jgi:hypothetical protein
MRIHAFLRTDDIVFLTVMHHIAIDLWSMTLIMEEMQALFLSQQLGALVPLPPPAAPYRKFVEWEAAMLSGPEGERQKAYWMKRLAGPLPLLQLPYDRPRPSVQSFRGKTLSFRLPSGLTARLEALARKRRTTLYTLLLGAYQVFLHRYCGQDDILVGSVMSGRTQPRFERVVGYLANPVVMRADLAGDPSFIEFLAQVWQTVQEALDHQNYPFSLIVERLLLHRDPSRGPLVDTVFVLQRTRRGRSVEEKKGDREITPFGVAERQEKGAQLALGGALVELFLVEHHTTKFDLELEMFEVGDELAGWFRYSTDLFDPETVASMSSNFLTLLQGVVEHPGHRLSELPLLSAAECREVLAASTPRQRLRTSPPVRVSAPAPIAGLPKPRLVKP